jgi:hypothetical protein
MLIRWQENNTMQNNLFVYNLSFFVASYSIMLNATQARNQPGFCEIIFQPCESWESS